MGRVHESSHIDSIQKGTSHPAPGKIFHEDHGTGPGFLNSTIESWDCSSTTSRLLADSGKRGTLVGLQNQNIEPHKSPNITL